MILAVYREDDGVLCELIRDGVVAAGIITRQNGRTYTLRSGLACVEVPDQDLSAFTRDGGNVGDILKYTAEKQAARVDAETDKEIGHSTHPFAPIGEQIGILRDQMVRMLNGDMTPSAEFTRFNEIAIAAIEAGRIKKEALDA